MRLKIDNFFTSGWIFDASDRELKQRYQMVNIGILLSSAGLIFGIIGNYLRGLDSFIPLEMALLCMNVVMFLALRRSRHIFELFAMIMTLQYTFLFLFLIYFSHPCDLKHLWIFTYPIILLYFQKTIHSLYWLAFILLMLLLAPLQSFIEIHYSLYQVFYLSFVLVIVSIIIYFYKKKIDEAKVQILQQQEMLQTFNYELERQVKEKTIELIKLNESLELKVEQKLEELRKKDQILEVQSKQAVMGEMISMIAHQWRQPLSTITLQIANLQLKHMLNNERRCKDVDEALGTISDTILYLSETVDDFQTYFRPNKESVKIELQELLQRSLNFALPRIRDRGIALSVHKQEELTLQTYANELVQVILNILNNAVDAHNATKGANPFIFIETALEKEWLTILIRDNAGGIREEYLPRLFEPYFSTKGKNGTGLGLYMSKMIIEKQFGGTIEVKTLHGETTFKIFIPRVVGQDLKN